MIGNTDPAKDGAKPGLCVGLSPTSDMYKAITSESAIMLPLCDPTVLYGNYLFLKYIQFYVKNIYF